jgi:hypothetical protein
MARYVVKQVPIIIATPPRYGIASLWVLWDSVGASRISILKATFLTSGVSTPTKMSAVKKRARYSEKFSSIRFL